MICAGHTARRLEDQGLEAALASKLLSLPQATLRDIGLRKVDWGGGDVKQ